LRLEHQRADERRESVGVILFQLPRQSEVCGLGPREDRNPDAKLFSESGANALRTSIAKACRAAGIPLFSPHDLRHRRVSLLHRSGRSWAEIGRFVGQRNLAVTANTYTHVLVDGEIDYRELLANVKPQA
jgi:integrase